MFADDENPTPDESDAFITDSRDGYSLTFDGRYIGTISGEQGMDAAVGAIVEAMEASNYWPNVWHVNDHGNTSLLLVTIDPHPSMPDFTWDYSDVAYV